MSSDFTECLADAKGQYIMNSEVWRDNLRARLSGMPLIYFDACGDCERSLFIRAVQAAIKEDQAVKVIADTITLIAHGHFALHPDAYREDAACNQPKAVATSLLWDQLSKPARLYWLTLPGAFRNASIFNVVQHNCARERYNAMVSTSREVSLDIERAAQAHTHLIRANDAHGHAMVKKERPKQGQEELT